MRKVIRSFGTVFDKIIKRQIPAQIVFEDDICLAFKDINPKAETHVLIIPKDHQGLTRISNANQTYIQFRARHVGLLGELMLRAVKVGKLLNLEGYRLVINDGELGGQTIYHLHIHLLSGKDLQQFH